jgi:hypothetical protein
LAKVKGSFEAQSQENERLFDQLQIVESYAKSQHDKNEQLSLTIKELEIQGSSLLQNTQVLMDKISNYEVALSESESSKQLVVSELLDCERGTELLKLKQFDSDGEVECLKRQLYESEQLVQELQSNVNHARK